MLRVPTLLLAYAIALAAPAIAAERIVLRAGERAVEMFVAKPAFGTRHPAILYVHGYQEARIGGRDMVDSGGLDFVAGQRGYVAASVSQPGYGGSDGPPDYCGPATQRAIRAALAHLRAMPEVDPERMVLQGISRGAIAAAVVAADEPTLRALVLISGAYDMAAAYPLLPTGIAKNFAQEAGATAEAFAARSALPHADRIRAATLILHGRRDFLPAAQAEALAAALAAHGRDVALALFDSGHFISRQDQLRTIKPFLSRVIGQPY